MEGAAQQLQDAPQKLTSAIGQFSLPGGIVFAPSYLQAGLVVFCIFLLILSFSMLQHRQAHWTVKGIMPGVAFGFTMALVIEAVLLVGGRTMLTEVLGWKDAPKPISNALEASRSHLVDVLGVTDTVSESNASEKPTVGGVVQSYESLPEDERESLQNLICVP